MRLKSNARWMDLPGVECAYQSIGAPSDVDALQNISHDHRSVGNYTATPGVLPTWSPEKGHTYNGTTQYLSTGWFPPGNAVSMVARYTNCTRTTAAAEVVMGCADRGASRLIHISARENNSFRIWRNGGVGSVTLAGVSFNGVIAMSYATAYHDGVAVSGAISVGLLPANKPMLIGALGNLDLNYFGDIPCALIASRTFTPAEMWLASRQMAYCEQNTDWNAWARRRMYFYAPSAAYAQRLLFAEQMRAMQ